MKNILVLGGAGYIGSHTVLMLEHRGYKVIVLDNLSSGHKQSLKNTNAILYIDEISKENLEKIAKEYKIDGIIYFAGSIAVGESMINPSLYLHNNLFNGVLVLDFMKDQKIDKIVFSSSAAIYGIPKKVPIKEDDTKDPINVYGFSKAAYEDILRFYDQIFSIKSVSLRYFNAAGASSKENIGEDHKEETHLIPLILKTALGERDSIKIYGDTYKTSDGTCIRDYIHVDDLASAHILALEYLLNNGESDYFNLGNGSGYSVKEIITLSKKITGVDFRVEIEDKREGDPDILIADSSKIQKKLTWIPQFSIEDIIKSAWIWHKNNPDGFL
jgi:UDP-glucose 4-epimerase